MPDDAAPVADPPARLTRLSVADAATVLSRSGEVPVTEEMIREDFEAGALLNPDGTLNLIHYAAWLVKELASHAD